jgi:hypothetical protein
MEYVKKPLAGKSQEAPFALLIQLIPEETAFNRPIE